MDHQAQYQPAAVVLVQPTIICIQESAPLAREIYIGPRLQTMNYCIDKILTRISIAIPLDKLRTPDKTAREVVFALLQIGSAQDLASISCEFGERQLPAQACGI